MTMTTTSIDQIAPLGREEAKVRSAAENERFAALLRSLDPDDWTRPTDCPDWDVRAMASHVLGAMAGNISFPQFVHQLRAGKKAAGDRPDIDGMTEVQVRERAHLGPAQIVAAVTAAAPKAARARAKVPGPLRRLPIKTEVAGTMETWRLGYLLDVIFTRDTWMHRIDLCRATGREPDLTAEHDGRLIADVVAEWARRHGRDVTLDLSGPAGGRYTAGSGGEVISLDAVEFCRILSGRASGVGLMTQEVPF